MAKPPSAVFRDALDRALEDTIGEMDEAEAYEVAAQWGADQQMALDEMNDAKAEKSGREPAPACPSCHTTGPCECM